MFSCGGLLVSGGEVVLASVSASLVPRIVGLAWCWVSFPFGPFGDCTGFYEGGDSLDFTSIPIPVSPPSAVMSCGEGL